MKLILCLVVIIISTKECDKNKLQTMDDSKTELTAEPSDMRLQDSKKITYRAATRGFFLKIWIEGDSISITEDYNLKDISTYKLPQEEKEALFALVDAIDETTLPSIEPPSTTFQYDAAAIATLEVSKGDEVYKTQAFDHGKPPKTITEVVDKILSIKAIVEKQ